MIPSGEHHDIHRAIELLVAQGVDPTVRRLEKEIGKAEASAVPEPVLAETVVPDYGRGVELIREHGGTLEAIRAAHPDIGDGGNADDLAAINDLLLGVADEVRAGYDPTRG